MADHASFVVALPTPTWGSTEYILAWEDVSLGLGIDDVNSGPTACDSLRPNRVVAGDDSTLNQGFYFVIRDANKTIIAEGEVAEL